MKVYVYTYQCHQYHPVVRFDALHYPDSRIQTRQDEACCQAGENDADSHALGATLCHVWILGASGADV